MRNRSALVIGAMAIGTLVSLSAPTGVHASSHREAPTIAEDPVADGTDVYAFVSPDKQDTVTLVANYIPFQHPAGGPNFYRFGDDVRYDINVDNVGDAKAHLTFSFTFSTATANGNTFLYNTGKIALANGQYQNWNRPQTYTVTMARDGGAPVTLGTNLLTPPDNVGPRSVGTASDYDVLAKAAVQKLNNGVTSFAGQRSDHFFADLGGIFDLLGVAQPFGAAGQNYLAGLNVNTIAIQVPKTLLDGPNNDHIIGTWSTASRHGTTVLNGDGTKTQTPDWVQVSRLGNPLVNEVVIGLGQKDLFNASVPANDAQFGPRVTSPELAGLLNALYGAKAPTTNRTDLAAVFLTGVPGLNKPNNANAVASEQLRLNYGIAPSSVNPNNNNRLGVLGGESDGFPNGRRLNDDVVDISLQAVDGILCQPGGPFAGNTPCRADKVPAALGDGVNTSDVRAQTCFPYLANPHGPDGAAPATSCPALTPSAASDAFVKRAYQDLLHRAPDAGGLAYWSGLLTNGQADYAGVARGLQGSEEYRSLVVNALFNQYLHRNVDASGMAYYVARLGSGLTDWAMAVELASSAEFTSFQGGSNQAYVSSIYSDVLGRTADSGGLAFWTNALNAGMSRSDVASAFVYSTEADQSMVMSWYQTFLHRAGDPGGVTFYTNALRSGQTPEAIIGANFVGSAEYVANATR